MLKTTEQSLDYTTSLIYSTCQNLLVLAHVWRQAGAHAIREAQAQVGQAYSIARAMHGEILFFACSRALLAVSARHLFELFSMMPAVGLLLLQAVKLVIHPWSLLAVVDPCLFPFYPSATQAYFAAKPQALHCLSCFGQICLGVKLGHQKESALYWPWN